MTWDGRFEQLVQSVDEAVAPLAAGSSDVEGNAVDEDVSLVPYFNVEASCHMRHGVSESSVRVLETSEREGRAVLVGVTSSIAASAAQLRSGWHEWCQRL